jgi:Fe-S-cluster containining protein
MNMRIKKLKVNKKLIMTPETKCDFCTGSTCCTYVTHQIDAPRSKEDFQQLLWQVSHDNVKIYKDEDGWTMLIDGKCQHLQVDGRCGIYFTRPEICREHSNDYCEYDAPSEDGFDLYFQNYEDLLAYCRKRFKRWDDQFK